MSLNQLRDEVYGLAIEKGQYPALGKTLSTTEILAYLAMMTEEIGEAVKEVRKGNLSVYEGEGDKPEGFPVEVIDLMIRCLGLCGAMGIDADVVFARKFEYNTGRPFLHGKLI